MKLSAKEKSRLKSQYGEWAVVTGASSGIGREIATLLAASGLNLIIVARNEGKLKALQTDLAQKHGTEVAVIASDISHNKGIQDLIEIAQHKEVGLLVAAAGYGTSGLFLNSSIHEEVNMLRLNCEAVLVLTHYFTQRFNQQKRGGIILFSSIVAFQGVPYSAHYAATKAYIQSLAEGLYHELKDNNVDILAAAPGPVLTGFAERADLKMGNVLKPEDVGVPILKALGKKTTVLPGTLTKVLAYSLRTVPRWAKVRIMKMVMGGMTKHQVESRK